MLSILWKPITCSYMYLYVIYFEKKDSNNDNGVIKSGKQTQTKTIISTSPF